MSWFDRIFGLEEIRERHRIASVRESLLFFGIDTRHLTDDQIVQGVQLFGDLSKQVGVSSQEAFDAFVEASRTIRI